MGYLGKTMETLDGHTIDVMRLYLIECSDCGPIDMDPATTRAEALQTQNAHHEYHIEAERRQR